VSELRRPRLSLDGEWRFVADPERLHVPGALPDGDPIHVPGCWEAQVDRPYKIVTAWYHRDVDIPDDWLPGRIAIRFGAVMYRCDVYVDAERVGGHEGGYTAFTVDEGEALRPGQRHRIAVRVVNPLNSLDEYPAFSVEELTLAEELEPDLPMLEAPAGKQTWYSSHSGLWQSVALERTHAVALDRIRVQADPVTGEVRVAWRLEAGLASRDSALRVDVIDPDGALAATESMPVADDSGQIGLTVADPRAWDIGRGILYRAELTLLERGRPVDAVETRFGNREELTRDGKIRLNGLPIYLLGALDQY
jgi:beta-galactosidase/beta-glucuronidase